MISFTCDCGFFKDWESCSEKTGSSKTKQRRWLPTFVAVNYLISGLYFADYDKTLSSITSGLSKNTFESTVKWCSREMDIFLNGNLIKVQNELKEHNKHLAWECTADGFYHIRGHYSPNCSVALYDLESGKVAFAHHSCKKGESSNFRGLIPRLTI